MVVVYCVKTNSNFYFEEEDLKNITNFVPAYGELFS